MSAAGELLERFADGDVRAGRHNPAAGAQEALVAVLYSQPFLRSEVYRIVVRDVEAEEVLQEVLLRIAKGVTGFRSESKMRTWARSIAHNTAVGHLRRRSETTGFDADVADGPGEVERFTSVLANRADVKAALDELPDDFSAVVRLRDLEQLTYQQIADQLGLNLNTVRSRLARGRTRLAVLLEQR